MFQHLCVILREFQNLYLAWQHKFLELKLLKLQFHKIIRLNYYFVIAEWYNIVCVTSQCLVKAVCLCGYIYNLQQIWKLMYGNMGALSWSQILNLRNDGLIPCYCCLFASLACTELGWVSGYVTCHLVTFAMITI
jgi:hypothetical protein